MRDMFVLGFEFLMWQQCLHNKLHLENQKSFKQLLILPCLQDVWSGCGPG